MSSATEQLRREAESLGFGWFGVAPAGFLEEEHEQFSQWLAEQRHGTMQWLERDPERRCDPGRVLEGCRSVIVVGLNYLRGPVEEPPPPPGHGRLSKYARTRDYHRVMENLLRRLSRASDALRPGSKSRFYVDYGPVLERPWARVAGIGFQGKHTLLINPDIGSFHFLGVILTTGEYEPTRQPPEHARLDCGDCTRCIDACPTGAITEPWRLDARRCLSYLTIEHTGQTDPVHHARHAGNVFGCDICQDVCPYNRRRAVPVAESPLGPLLVPADVPLAELIARPGQFLDALGETASPLKRAGEESLCRNAAIVAVDLGNAETLAAIETALATADLPDWLIEHLRRCGELLKRRLHNNNKS